MFLVLFLLVLVAMLTPLFVAFVKLWGIVIIAGAIYMVTKDNKKKEQDKVWDNPDLW